MTRDCRVASLLSWAGKDCGEGMGCETEQLLGQYQIVSGLDMDLLLTCTFPIRSTV